MVFPSCCLGCWFLGRCPRGRFVIPRKRNYVQDSNLAARPAALFICLCRKEKPNSSWKKRQQTSQFELEETTTDVYSLLVFSHAATAVRSADCGRLRGSLRPHECLRIHKLLSRFRRDASGIVARVGSQIRSKIFTSYHVNRSCNL